MRKAKLLQKKQFLDYLSSLHGCFANDEILAAERSRVSRCNITVCTFPEQIASERSIDSSDVESGESCETSSTSKALTLQRHTPGYALQFRILLRRVLIQWWRKNTQRALFLAAMSAGAIVLAVMDTMIVRSPRWEALSFLNTDTCLALLCAIFCLQVFGNDQPVFWRERSSGLNVLAFYQARTLVNTLDLVLQVFFFTALYFLIRQPHVPFAQFLIPYVLVTYAASGWGYFISTIVPPRHGPFITSLVIFIVCGLLGSPQNLEQFLDGGWLQAIVSVISITRWSVVMSFDFQIRRMHPNINMTDMAPRAQDKLSFEQHALEGGDWGIGPWWTPFLALCLMGSVLRIFGYLGLRFMNRAKQV